MDSTGIQPVMPMGNTGLGGFSGEGLWLFAILALMWGGGGGLFGANRGIAPDGRVATVEDLNNSANFSRLEQQVMNNGNRIEQKADAAINGICNLGYELAQQFGTTRTQMADCCCEQRLAAANTNAHIDQAAASINANTTAGIQKVLDTLCADKLAAQAARIQQLELAQAMQGVVRYPTAYTYNAGQSPFCCCNNGCGCGNI